MWECCNVLSFVLVEHNHSVTLISRVNYTQTLFSLKTWRKHAHFSDSFSRSTKYSVNQAYSFCRPDNFIFGLFVYSFTLYLSLCVSLRVCYKPNLALDFCANPPDIGGVLLFAWFPYSCVFVHENNWHRNFPFSLLSFSISSQQSYCDFR